MKPQSAKASMSTKRLWMCMTCLQKKDRTSKKRRLLSAEHSLNGNLLMTFQSSPTITFARSFKSQMQMRLRKSKPIITHHLVKELEIIWSKEWTRSNMIIFQLVQGIDMKSFRLSVRGFEGTILTSITQIEKVYWVIIDLQPQIETVKWTMHNL